AAAGTTSRCCNGSTSAGASPTSSSTSPRRSSTRSCRRGSACWRPRSSPEDAMQAGLVNTYQHPVSSRQAIAWLLSALLVVSYLLLSPAPPRAVGLRWDVFQAGATAVGLKSKWTLYGLLYTVAMIAGGLFSLRRHGSSRYHLVRTTTVVLVQIVLGFTLP